jgi:hypothetical protein
VPGRSTQALLAAWEQGLAEPQAIGRTMALLGAAYPDVAPLFLAQLSIGERDDVLLQLQEEVFGGHVGALVDCPKCSERLELSFELAEVRVASPGGVNAALTASHEQYQVEFRLPNSRDLLALMGPEDLEKKRVRLLERIILRAQCVGSSIGAQELPEDLISAMEAEMQAADPQAEIILRSCCQSCGHEWNALFDPGAFLWKQVDAWAIRVLEEVHLLATAYGWGEADILAMTPWRRHAYLEMLSV